MTAIRIATKTGKYTIEVKSDYSDSEQACCCPVCVGTHTIDSDDKKKCASFNSKKGTFHCNHCGIGGTTMTDDQFVDIHQKVKPLSKPFMKSELSLDWINWLSTVRRISQKTAEDMNLHTVSKMIKWDAVPEDYPNRDEFVGKYFQTMCLAAFYVYKDVLINVQYRDMFKNFAFESGCDLVFFNADIISKNKIVMITEGWMDTVACKEVGLVNVCSVPNGTTITPDEKKIFERTGSIEILSEPNLKYLDNCWDDFKDVDEIVLATDSDAAGQKLMEILRRRFINAKKKVSRINFKLLPDDPTKKKKDFNDVLVYYGKDAVVMLYERREVFRPASIVTVHDVSEEIDRHFANGVPPARKIGWISMDPSFGYYPGDIVVANGYPANGKTVVNQNIMSAISKKFNSRWLIYSPENYPAALFFEAIMEIYSGKTMDKTKPKSFATEGGISYNEAKEWVHEYFRIANKRTAFTLPELRDLAVQENCQGMFVDPWNRLVRDSKHRGSVISDYIQEELTEQIAYGLETGITSIISVHPPTQDKKNRKYDDNGEFDHPSIYEAEGGKVWASSAHVMFCPHRPMISDMNNKQTYLYVQKLKDHKLYGRPPGDKYPFIFEMRTSCRRLYLNNQSPLDAESPLQLNLYDSKAEINSTKKSPRDTSHGDDLPF